VQHVLPPRFVKIRHYGLHAAANATTRLELARERLGPRARLRRERVEPRPIDWRELLLQLTCIDVRVCPACHEHALVRGALPNVRAPPEAA
jgi:hypothetical protein